MRTRDVSRFDAYFKAGEDEPTFTLLARDRMAPGIIKQWAYTRERLIVMGLKPEADREVIAEARKIARDMEDWYRENRADEISLVDDKLKFNP